MKNEKKKRQVKEQLVNSLCILLVGVFVLYWQCTHPGGIAGQTKQELKN